MNMFGIPKTQNLEAKPRGDIQKAFIKNLIGKKDGFYEEGEGSSMNEVTHIFDIVMSRFYE